jgi:hypothetical protein
LGLIEDETEMKVPTETLLLLTDRLVMYEAWTTTLLVAYLLLDYIYLGCSRISEAFISLEGYHATSLQREASLGRQEKNMDAANTINSMALDIISLEQHRVKGGYIRFQ